MEKNLLIYIPEALLFNRPKQSTYLSYLHFVHLKSGLDMISTN